MEWSVAITIAALVRVVLRRVVRLAGAVALRVAVQAAVRVQDADGLCDQRGAYLLDDVPIDGRPLPQQPREARERRLLHPQVPRQHRQVDHAPAGRADGAVLPGLYEGGVGLVGILSV